MEIAIRAAQTVVPVLTLLALGYALKRFKVIGLEVIVGLKKLIADILLPLVIFNAIASAQYNMDVLVTVIVMFCACALALGSGFLFKKAFSIKEPFFPFMLSNFEIGMLGYAFFSLLVGKENLQYMAMCDMANCMFGNFFFLPMMAMLGGAKKSKKEKLISMFASPLSIATILGLIMGITGGYSMLITTGIGSVIAESINFVISPTTAIILLCVGYEFTLRKELVGAVAKPILSRLLLMACLCAITVTVLFLIIPFNPLLLYALILCFALPVPFVAASFARTKEDSEYVSTTISLYLPITILAFLILAVITAV